MGRNIDKLRLDMNWQLLKVIIGTWEFILLYYSVYIFSMLLWESDS